MLEFTPSPNKKKKQKQTKKTPKKQKTKKKQNLKKPKKLKQNWMFVNDISHIPNEFSSVTYTFIETDRARTQHCCGRHCGCADQNIREILTTRITLY